MAQPRVRIRLKRGNAWSYICGWGLERIMYKQPWADAKTLQCSIFGSWREKDSLGYDKLHMVRDGVQSKSKHTATAKGTLERDCQRRRKAARRNIPKEFLALGRAKVPCRRLSIPFGLRERISPELHLQGGGRVPFNVN